MNESYIQTLFADRIGGTNFGKSTQLYKFEKIAQAKKAAKNAHPEIELIDMGIGEPDEMANLSIVEVLAKEAAKPENRVYPDNGVYEYKEAAARYLKSVYNVSGINPSTEVMHCIGAKAALTLLPAAFINPGDVLLMTVPGYPDIAVHTRWYGGEVVNLPITKENSFLPDLTLIDKDILKKTKMIYLNYPNNPTGACANAAFFSKVVEFAKENNIIVVHDAAYGALTYDEEEPLSFLSVPGAKEVGVEVHSMSKAFNMTGWRLGFIAGNELIIKAYADVKDNSDSGQFIAIQKASVYALNNYQITHNIAKKYSRRLELLANALKEAGFDAVKPKGSFFLYVEIPKKFKNGREFKTAEEFSQFLISEKLISTVPWDDAGHFIRFSVTFFAKNEQDEIRVINELKNRLIELQLEF